LFGNAEVALDRGDALKRVINFPSEAGHVLQFLREVVERRQLYPVRSGPRGA
jgi:hypothetical protein